MKRLSIVLLAGLSLSACETAKEMQAASQKGFANSISCPQISSAFAAYEADKQSLSALMQLGNLTNLDTSKITTETAAGYYEKAKQSANLALVLQGCAPL